MRRQWIMIGQSILKTIRTIGDNMPFWGRQEQNANVREIAAGYGWYGDQWYKLDPGYLAEQKSASKKVHL